MCSLFCWWWAPLLYIYVVHDAMEAVNCIFSGRLNIHKRKIGYKYFFLVYMFETFDAPWWWVSKHDCVNIVSKIMQRCHSFNWEDTNVLKSKKKRGKKTEYVDKRKEWTQHYPREQIEAVQIIAVLTSPTLKLQIRIDFKWKRKVVLAVKGSSSSCQIRNTQWRWQIALNYTGHYGQSLSNYTHWVGRIAVIDIMCRPFFYAVDSFITDIDFFFSFSQGHN